MLTVVLAAGIRKAGHTIRHERFFDTIKIGPSCGSSEIRKRAEKLLINLRYFDDGDVGISIDETTKTNDIQDLLDIFTCSTTVVS